MSLHRVALRCFGMAVAECLCSSVAGMNQSHAIRDEYDRGKGKEHWGATCCDEICETNQTTPWWSERGQRQELVCKTLKLSINYIVGTE